MADYRELLRRAIAALPENNGAARRAVYEKARSALVGQLRAITPPLPARDITQHRLQLEDCIRQVEQEASEAVITLGREDIRPSASPAPAIATVPEASTAAPAEPPQPPAEAPKPASAAENGEPARDEPEENPREPARASATSIEEIISQAEAVSAAPEEAGQDKPAEDEAPPAVQAEPDPKPASELRVMPAIVARVQAKQNGPTSPVPHSSNVRPLEAPLKGPSFEPRRDAIPLAANGAETSRVTTRIEPAMGNQAVARRQVVETVTEPEPVEAALSSVREVEVESAANEAQDVIERAIEVLDREARGESTPPLSASSFAQPSPTEESDDDAGFADAPAERGGAGLTIFLVVFAILLAGAGGAGFWAWREGYVDLDQMFGQVPAAVTETGDVPAATTPTLDPVQPSEPADNASAGPGNTTPATTGGQADAELSGLEIEDRLEPTPEPVQPTGNETVLPDVNGGEAKSEERLTGSETEGLAVADPTTSVDPAVLAGSQSLLLEASQDGTTGAVPFSGTVEWSRGVDDLGLPTLIGSANIPARNLGVDITIRKNSDPSLPASHLMEIDFDVSDTFIGGTIATLPGVLLKNEELVPGTALVGASARVVGNSFLFALSATPSDAETNRELLENRRWMDLAVVYGTGRNAIITLEKDEAALELFSEVFAAWSE